MSIRERRGIVQALITAISTKPFVLLAGISGSGKTQLARRIAAGLAAGLVENGRYTGRLAHDDASGAGFRDLLAQNGVVPELQGSDPNAFVDVDELRPAANDAGGRRNLKDTLRDRVAFLPVRPDWADARKIWGYYNPLTGLYYPTDALRVVMHAYLEYLKYGDAAPRHFLILDELNLARVEYYLSDLLSLMEVPCVQLDNGDFRLGEMASVHPFSRPLWSMSAPSMEMGKETSSHERQFIGRLDYDWGQAYNYLCLGNAGAVAPRIDIDLDRLIDGADWARLVPPRIAFTPNLCIFGTVNVDETTFSFAPKVLDRAFVLEFNDVDYDAVCSDWPGYDAVRDELATLLKILRPADMHFGYRVVDELLGFLQNAGGGGWDVHGDFLLASKVLPKLRGGEDKLGPVLAPLLVYAITGENEIGALHAGAADVIIGVSEGEPLPRIIEDLGRDRARYPITADKVHRMTRQLLDSGLASFF